MKSYIIKIKDEYILSKSRSGGAFTIFSDIILNKNGVVYGCKLNNDFVAVHNRAETKEERDEFRGSKYVQSELNAIFNSVKQDLLANRYVLFSGTACQIAGLINYLSHNYLSHNILEKLFCIDIICHGVPSPKVWKDYLEYNKIKYNGEVSGACFINKEQFGWKAHKETIWINDVPIHSNIFTHLFRDHNILRPSCFVCPFKKVPHISDITIGDAWGVEKNNPEFYNNKGTSLVIINSEKGKKLFNLIETDCILVEVEIDAYLQKALISPYDEPRRRNKFWNDYNKYSFVKIVNKYIEPTIKNRIKWKINQVLKFKQERKVEITKFDFGKKYNCCGCTACYNICSHNAIKMIDDEEGFKYPCIDKSKCINCKLCEKVCPMITKWR